MAAVQHGAMVSVMVPHARPSVGVARRALADHLRMSGVGARDVEDAVLVLSELLSNAIKHAAALPAGELKVCWSVDDDSLHVEVTDGGATTRPHAAVAAVSALGGRGLDIVRNVTSTWGVTESQDSVTVWADVPRTRMGLGRAG
ncbi:MAG: ATP-binding protein [Actinomycetes bacterium]